MVIEIVGEEKRPRIICPKCKKIQYIDLNIFKKDITKIMKDNCIGCGAELFVATMIIVNSSYYGISDSIKKVVEVLSPMMINEK